MKVFIQYVALVVHEWKVSDWDLGPREKLEVEFLTINQQKNHSIIDE